MQEKINESFAWSIYWSEDRLQSCVAAGDGADQDALNSVWIKFAQELGEGAKVLDLATGNGAVPVALLRAQPSLAITAVDRADINPAAYIKNCPELDKVTFIGNIDLNQLAIPSTDFAAITSQFGLEYAGLASGSDAALKLLSKTGKFKFLVHHSDSEIVQSSGRKLAEMKRLLETGGLIEMLISFLRGDIPFTELEMRGQSYINSDEEKTASISGAVFSGIEQIANLCQSNPEQARKLGATLSLRLQSEHDRLEQMQAAAQSEPQMSDFQSHLEKLGFTITTLEPMKIENDKQPYLLAWHICGHKT